MASLNKCFFIGNLGKDPEIRVATNGNKYASFTIACSESWKDKSTGEKKERTEWVSCVAWGALAGVLENYSHKGSKIHISGKYTTRSWDDQSGQKKYKTEIIVDSVILLDSKQDQGQSSYDSTQSQDDSSDIPF